MEIKKLGIGDCFRNLQKNCEADYKILEDTVLLRLSDNKIFKNGASISTINLYIKKGEFIKINKTYSKNEKNI